MVRRYAAIYSGGRGTKEKSIDALLRADRDSKTSGWGKNTEPKKVQCDRLYLTALGCVNDANFVGVKTLFGRIIDIDPSYDPGSQGIVNPSIEDPLYREKREFHAKHPDLDYERTEAEFRKYLQRRKQGTG